MSIIYATTNTNKFNKAVLHLKPHGVELRHEHFEVDEPQTPNGEQIVRYKAEQAFEQFQQPVLVNDDTWSVEALRGFPSTGMKLCNDFLLAEDWLRLMQGVENRTIWLISHYAFYDGKTMQFRVGKDKRYFLDEPQGSYAKSPVLEVVARVGSNQSLAHEVATGRKVEQNNAAFWADLADVLMR